MKRASCNGGLGAWPVGAAIALILAAPACAEDLVIGRSASWVRSVDNRLPGAGHDGSAPRAPLYFWMTYHGSAAALKRLREDGALPIRHRWSVAAGGDVEVELPDDAFTERLSVPLMVGSGNEDIIARLAGQFASRQAFTWRTWSKKESVSRGIWRVDVLYDDDTPVACEVGGHLRPCVFRIEVR